jgi:hypothetical protein
MTNVAPKSISFGIFHSPTRGSKGNDTRKRLTTGEARIAHQSRGHEPANTSRIESCKASSIIRHLDNLLHENNELLAVRYMRTSTSEQRKYGNLRNRHRWLRSELKRRKVKGNTAFSEVADSRSLQNRWQLIGAIDEARLLQMENPRATVAVVTDTRNRFLRGRFFNGQAHTDPPSADQLEVLKKLARGVILATVVHPDTPFHQVRSYETNVPTRVGEKAGRKVGRPKLRVQVKEDLEWTKRDIRREKTAVAVQLLNENLSQREIAKQLGVPESTVRYWLKKAQP